jgi:ABC-type antimicrobial peptide transport system permease subunit
LFRGAVTERTRELGIRVALGAQRGELLKLVVAQGMSMAFAGLAVGMIAALAVTRLMARFLFGVSATDPLTFAAILFLLAAVSLAACWIPARRATRVGALVAALRND